MMVENLSSMVMEIESLGLFVYCVCGLFILNHKRVCSGGRTPTNCHASCDHFVKEFFAAAHANQRRGGFSRFAPVAPVGCWLERLTHAQGTCVACIWGDSQPTDV